MAQASLFGLVRRSLFEGPGCRVQVRVCQWQVSVSPVNRRSDAWRSRAVFRGKKKWRWRKEEKEKKADGSSELLNVRLVVGCNVLCPFVR